MKKISFALFLISLITNSYSQKKPCSDFKTGKFEYTNPKFSEWKVTRTDSTQTEISSITGVELNAKVKWKTNCEFVLTYKNIINSKESTEIIGKQIFVEIFEIQDSEFKYDSKFESTELTSEMIKVE